MRNCCSSLGGLVLAAAAPPFAWCSGPARRCSSRPSDLHRRPRLLDQPAQPFSLAPISRPPDPGAHASIASSIMSLSSSSLRAARAPSSCSAPTPVTPRQLLVNADQNIERLHGEAAARPARSPLPLGTPRTAVHALIADLGNLQPRPQGAFSTGTARSPNLRPARPAYMSAVDAAQLWGVPLARSPSRDP